jgi:hypothetical protein
MSIFLLLTDINELLYCLSVFYSRILMNSCIVCPSSTHRYWWTLVLSVRLLLTDIDELLYCLCVFYSIHLFVSLFTLSSHCDIYFIYDSKFWILILYVYWTKRWTLVLSVRFLLTDIDELLYCLSVFYSQILMNSCIVCLSSTHRQTIQEFINICE